MNLYVAIFFVGVIIYLINRYFHSYWSLRGVFSLEPIFFIGNLNGMLSFKKCAADYFFSIRNKYKNHKFIGAYFFYQPVLIIHDPELIQDIMIRNFTSFHDRPMPADAVKNYPIIGHLFTMRGQKWRDLRVKLSPTFTSGKLKAMFPIINDCADVLEKYVEKKINEGSNIFEIRDLFARLTTNIISNIAFGIENDCINDRENIFRKMGIKVFEPNFRNGLVSFLIFFAPDLLVKTNLDPIGKEITDFMYSIVKQTVDFREKNNIERNDFMQMLIKLKNEGYVQVDKADKEEANSYGHDENAAKTKIDMDELTANVFLFFVAGFESSSSTTSFCLYELCKNPEVQRKAQEEIDRVLKASDDELTYDNLAKMKYVDCCLDETLRKHPTNPLLFRFATQDYTIPNTNVKIQKGTKIFVPLLGLHRDPEIFENPLEFKPERFLDSPNGNGNSKGLFYLPFGGGPRNCIGGRMGKLQSKISLVHVLRRFNFEYANKSMQNEEIEYHPTQQLLLTPKETIMIRVTRR